jgi:hypothetical protein
VGVAVEPELGLAELPLPAAPGPPAPAPAELLGLGGADVRGAGEDVGPDRPADGDGERAGAEVVPDGAVDVAVGVALDTDGELGDRVGPGAPVPSPRFATQYVTSSRISSTSAIAPRTARRPAVEGGLACAGLIGSDIDRSLPVERC